MKKVLSYILISLIIFVNLFAPFSVGIEENKTVIINNTANAEYNYNLKITPTMGDNYISIYVEKVEGSDVSDMAIGFVSQNANIQVYATVLDNGEEIDEEYTTFGESIKDATIKLNGSWPSSLKQDTPYKTKIEVKERVSTYVAGGGVAGGSGTQEFYTLYTTIIDTPTTKTGEQVVTTDEINVNGSSDTIKKVPAAGEKADMPACGFLVGEGTVMGCVAQGFYYVLFVPTSYLFALAGTFFDNTFSYSVQDTSYRSSFVVSGWGLVRDFCNMFFIFILLYTAIATTLSLNGFKTKETIINVVIIGLFINFSLFATQIIIDASNITARVFYNADSIKITENGANGPANLQGAISGATNGTPTGSGGVIPLSAALVNKVNPQNLIINSKKINNVPVKGNNAVVSGKDVEANMGVGTFILIVIMASAVNIVGFIVFLSVGLVFVARVIGLWLAMITAPLAFFTYILPEMSGLKMIGWKNWWPETFKMAFLAPVFIFFMYIILKFLEMDNIIPNSSSGEGLAFFISILMPFAFIMILLMKAKKIATDMAGEMGAMAAKAGGTLGGIALGAATGGAALAMRGTVGRLGSAMANSERMKSWESKGYFGAKSLRNISTKVGAGSFDARNTKLGGMAAGGLGVNLGKGKEGGFVKDRADKTAERIKRAKELELGDNSKEKVALRKSEVSLKGLQDDNSKAMTSIDGDLPAARQKVADAQNKMLAIDPADTEKIAAARLELQKQTDWVSDLLKQKKHIKSGGINKETKKDSQGNEILDANGNTITEKHLNGTNLYHTTNKKISKTEHDNKIKDEKEKNDELAKTVASSTNEGNSALEKRTKDTEAIDTALAEEIDKIEKIAQDKITAAQNAPAIAAKKVADAISAAIAAENLASAIPDDKNKAAAVIARTNANNTSDEAAKFITNAQNEAANANDVADKEKESAKNKATADIKAVNDEYQKTVTKLKTNIATAQSEALSAKAAADVARADAIDGFGKSIEEIDDIDIPEQKNTINIKNNKRKRQYADYLGSTGNHVANLLTASSTIQGTDEAADKIRQNLEVKQ